MNKNNCTIISKNSRVKVEENGRKAVFINDTRSEYKVTTIDNCLITEGVRADFLVSKVGSTSVLVELKGCDIKHACDQLLSSAEREEVRQLLEASIGFVIVCRRYPRFDTYVARAKARSAKQFKAGFHIVCDQRELYIEKVAAINGM